MNDFYEQTYDVRVLDTDLFGLCRPSSVMNFLQETAASHSVELGIGREDMASSSHAIWMLVRLRYTLFRPLHGDEELKVKTWYRTPHGAFIQRDFELSCNGERIGYALSTWVLADVNNHTLLKAEDLIAGNGASKDELFTEKLGKIRMPKELEEVSVRQLGYSETDVNGHINNTRYADYACDAIHFEKLTGKYVKEFQITYSAECLAGQTLHMLCKNEDNTFYVRGVDKDQKSHFDIRMELAEI